MSRPTGPAAVNGVPHPAGRARRSGTGDTGGVVAGPAGRRLAVLLAGFTVGHLAQYGAFLLSWLVLGRAVLAGSVGTATLVGWAAATTASLVCRAVTVALQAELVVALGGSLRRRLLRGALGLDQQALVRAGAGRLLGQLLEAESLEDQVIGESLPGLAAVLDLGLAAIPLTAALGPVALVALVGWLAAAGWAVGRYGQHRARWTAARLGLGDDVIAKLAGHRTRAVQQPPARRHDGEATALAGYLAVARPMDRCRVALAVLVPRGWALTGVVLLSVAAANAASQPTVALGAAGVLFTTAALTRLTAGGVGLADARAAWQQLRPLLATPAVAPPEPAGVGPDGVGPDGVVSPAGDPALVVAEAVGYRYPGRDRPALAAIDLRIGPGDRLLLDGPSGAGKSTLAAVLAGARRPTAGALRVPPSPGSRPSVLTVPPADHNHLLLAPLALNLLVGRGWPAGPGDLADAEQVCRALGLGDLLDRMPAGLAQFVGETGWQLSAGQRSLVFLARALLQDPDVLILDQTLDALDPATLDAALAVAARRPGALLVIRS
ncbi:MAG: ATP-binding cassette, subfamily bacterial [Mycobacteriales bacterium]